MISHTSYITFLKSLPRAEVDRTLEHSLSDTLEQLGVAITSAAVARGHALHNCVVDDLQLVRAEVGEKECRAFLRFVASARRGETGRRGSERLSGSAEVSIDDAGAVSYLGITLTEERGFVPNDEGGEG
jgi:hypothetical protein